MSLSLKYHQPRDNKVCHSPRLQDYSTEVHPWRMKNQSMYVIQRTFVLVAVKRPLNGAWDPVVAFHIFLFSPKQTILIDVTDTLKPQFMIQFSQPGLYIFNEAKYCLASVTVFQKPILETLNYKTIICLSKLKTKFSIPPCCPWAEVVACFSDRDFTPGVDRVGPKPRDKEPVIQTLKAQTVETTEESHIYQTMLRIIANTWKY